MAGQPGQFVGRLRGVALVQVGNGPSANLAAAKAAKLAPFAAKRMTPLLAQAK